MEAVNKIINTASNAIWGESNTNTENTADQEHNEPISGVQGRGDASDPYDAGNREGKSSSSFNSTNTFHIKPPPPSSP